MEQRRADDVWEIVRSGAFSDWFERYREVHRRLVALHQATEDPLVDGLLRAGEYEEIAACAQARFVQVESSFDLLERFELQRQRATAIWVELEGVENRLEEISLRVANIGSSLDKAASAQAIALLNQQKQLTKEVQRLELLLEGENEKKGQLWSQVQQSWTAAFRAKLEHGEGIYLARRARREAQQHRQSMGEEPAPVEKAEEETTALEAALHELRQEAEQKFACLALHAFLYWPDKNDLQGVLCVPLFDDMDNLNIQVKAPLVYRFDRDHGLGFVEPLAKASDEIDNRRLDAFFLRVPKERQPA